MTQDGLFSEQGDSEAWSYEEAVKSFFDRRRFLKVLHDYIIFLTKDDELTKVILRQHQTARSRRSSSGWLIRPSAGA